MRRDRDKNRRDPTPRVRTWLIRTIDMRHRKRTAMPSTFMRWHGFLAAPS
jgi:hypothetical protein